MTIIDYIRFLLQPAIETGYTWDKTLFYGIIFVIAAFLIFNLLKKLKVRVNRELAVAIAPFIIFGGTLRVARDLGIAESALFATPYIYFFVAIITIALLLISLAIEKRFRIRYSKILFISGLILATFTIANIPILNAYGILIVLALFAPFLLFFSLFKKWSLENRTVTSVQILDSIVTFTSINFFGYGEQHILPNFFITTFGPFSFIVLKVVAVVLSLFLIDKLSDDKELNNYIKLIIGILALGTSTRDFSCLLSFCSPS